jgi:RNA polymerase sigma-70 factor (ECF subfamily)
LTSLSDSVGGVRRHDDEASRVSDRSELEKLVPHVYPWATSVAYLLCRDMQQAQDLVQDALVQAVRRPPRPLDVPTLRAWLRPVIFRLYLRHRSRARREALALLRVHRERPPEPPAGPGDAVVAALDLLSPRQRACIVLRYVEDLPETEVAELLGLRLGTVKAHLAPARERLRGVLPS